MSRIKMAEFELNSLLKARFTARRNNDSSEVTKLDIQVRIAEQRLQIIRMEEYNAA